MAVAGGATTAYRCWIQDDFLQVARTTTLRTECTSVEDALLPLGRGEVVTVAGSDMAALRAALSKAGALTR